MRAHALFSVKTMLLHRKFLCAALCTFFFFFTNFMPPKQDFALPQDRQH